MTQYSSSSSSSSSRESVLIIGPAKAVLLAAVAVGAFIEVSTSHRQYGWLVDLFALTAVGAVGVAVALGSEAAATLSRRRELLEAEFERGQAAPNCRYSGGGGTVVAPAKAARPQVFLRERPTDLHVPRFGEGAPAQGFPWLLPERTVQNGIAADEATVGAFSIRAASVIGPSHRCQQPADPRQDSYRIGRTRDHRYAIVAVADGISSAALSDAGATTASSQAVTLLRDRIDRVGFHELDAKELYQKIAESVAGQAVGRGVGTADLSTVLITAVIEEPGPDGTAEAWVAWLGDSSGWLLTPDSPRWRCTSGDVKDRAAAVVSNEVAGRLPDTPHLAQDQYLTLPPGAALALVTDGIGDAWADPAGRVNDYFANAWRTPIPATRFTADVGFDAPQCLDDRTAAVVWNGVRP